MYFQVNTFRKIEIVDTAPCPDREIGEIPKWTIYRCPACGKLIFETLEETKIYNLEAYGGCQLEGMICPHCGTGISIESFPNMDEIEKARLKIRIQIVDEFNQVLDEHESNLHSRKEARDLFHKLKKNPVFKCSPDNTC